MVDLFDTHIVDVPNFPKKGVVFKDITPLLEDGEAFSIVVNSLADTIFDRVGVPDKIICSEARGFIFGAPVAYRLGCGLVIARKPHKLPRPGVSKDYDLEYGKDTLQVSEGAINSGERVVIIDDLIATGGSAKAMCDIVVACGGIPLMAAFVIELREFRGVYKLPCDVAALVTYGATKGDKILVNLTSVVDEDQLRYTGEEELTVVDQDEDTIYVEWEHDFDQVDVLSLSKDMVTVCNGRKYRR